MATLMVKYASPSEYALIDMSAGELEVVAAALREYQNFIERMGGQDHEDAKIAAALLEALSRRYDDD